MASDIFPARTTNCDLSRLGQFAALPAETRARIAAICHPRHYAAGQTVVHEAESTDFIGCVATGFLRMQKTLSDGRQSIVGLLVEGDIFGRVFDGPVHFAIEAATDAEICAFQRRPFEAELMRSPELERLMLLNVMHELDRARDWLVILSSKKVTGRIAGFLLVVCSHFAMVDHLLRRSGGLLEVLVPIGRADLAHLLGTRTESRSRGFHALADAGLIEILRPDLIRLLDIEGLAAETGDEDLTSRPNLEMILRELRRRA